MKTNKKKPTKHVQLTNFKVFSKLYGMQPYRARNLAHLWKLIREDGVKPYKIKELV